LAFQAGIVFAFAGCNILFAIAGFKFAHTTSNDGKLAFIGTIQAILCVPNEIPISSII
jgi:hypothetical protein